MTVLESISFLSDRYDSLFHDERMDECAANLKAAYDTISRIRSVAGEYWDQLNAKYMENPNENKSRHELSRRHLQHDRMGDELVENRRRSR